MSDAKLLLPQTKEAFEELINTIYMMTASEDLQHVRAVIADRIQRIPPDQAYVEIDYLCQCVQKSRAYLLARSISSEIQSKHSVDEIMTHLKTSPDDQQARDQLEAAAKSGNPYAQAALVQLSGDTKKVVSLCQPETVMTDAGQPTAG